MRFIFTDRYDLYCRLVAAGVAPKAASEIVKALAEQAPGGDSDG